MWVVNQGVGQEYFKFSAPQDRSWPAVKKFSSCIWSKMSKHRGMRLGCKLEKLRKVISTSRSLPWWRSCIWYHLNSKTGLIFCHYATKDEPRPNSFRCWSLKQLCECAPSNVSWRYKAKNTYRKKTHIHPLPASTFDDREEIVQPLL